MGDTVGETCIGDTVGWWNRVLETQWGAVYGRHSGGGGVLYGKHSGGGGVLHGKHSWVRGVEYGGHSGVVV